MGFIFKPEKWKPLPDDAKIVKIKGRWFAEWTDDNGKSQRKSVKQRRDGSWRIVQACGVYLARYKDADGKTVTRSTGCRTQDAARSELARFEREAERERVGALTPRERRFLDHGNRSVLEHVADYTSALVSRGTTQEHVDNTERFLKFMIDACGWNLLRDMNREAFERWIGRLRVEPRRIPKEDETKRADDETPLSARSVNARIVAAKAFGSWLVEVERLGSNPFAGIRTLNERTDRRRPRRALTLEELAKVINAAERRPLADRRHKNPGNAAKLQGATITRLESVGRKRGLVIRMLAYTGLRYGELRSLTIGQLRLNEVPPCIELYAKDEKARRGAVLPLHADLLVTLNEYLSDMLSAAQRAARKADGPIPMALDPSVKLFDLPASMVRVFDRDLAFAGIDKIDAHGRTLDIHSLRATFASELARSGVSLQQAAQLMRHSDPRLTMGTYTHLSVLDGAAAVSQLPALPHVEKGTVPKVAHAEDTPPVTVSLTVSKKCSQGHSESVACIEAGKGDQKRDRKRRTKSPVFTGDFATLHQSSGKKDGRGDWIRTSDLLTPSQVR
ncbi:MAG: hypothetical protein AMXMBFR82_49040 [Candidatus Hydrogenedentota bacterium]